MDDCGHSDDVTHDRKLDQPVAVTLDLKRRQRKNQLVCMIHSGGHIVVVAPPAGFPTIPRTLDRGSLSSTGEPTMLSDSPQFTTPFACPTGLYECAVSL